jgi:hypothetical protein
MPTEQTRHHGTACISAPNLRPIQVAMPPFAAFATAATAPHKLQGAVMTEI